jgi:hypothetical protein
METKTITQFLYDKNDQRIGVLAASGHPLVNRVHIGWSLCAANKGDKFDKERGLQIAIARSERASTVEIPQSIQASFTHFAKRARKYFKDKTIVNG